MQAGKRVVLTIMALLLLVPLVQDVSAQSGTAKSGSLASLPPGVLAPSVSLGAASEATIRFVSQNGRTVRGSLPQDLDLPHLVLTRNGALTDPVERTLLVTVADLVVPPGGVMVTLAVETYHPDPDLDGAPGDHIAVWHESAAIANPLDSTQRGGTLLFRCEFSDTVVTAAGPVATPTDYFRVRVDVFEAGVPASAPAYTIDRDPAFLLERQRLAPLVATARASDSAGPAALMVYYCDMFPFQRDIHEPTTWLPRAGVPAYVETELLPEMVEAVRVQTEDWGFVWSEAWTSYRDGPDARRLSVALSADKVWYHGQAPLDGQAAMTIRITGGPNTSYETLTDGIMSTFHHELFHNLQRSIAQEVAGHGLVAGRDDAWEFFSEGTAVLASSVGQLAVQFAPSQEPRAYLFRAKLFVGGSGFAGDLNNSYGQITPYHAAIYWRYLFERCGGLQETRTGMALIHRALELLYSKEILDIAPSDGAPPAAGLVSWLPAIIDAVLASPEAASCPFRTYEDSLVHLSRDIYGLRLEGGRCTAPGEPAGCGFYDPNAQYNAPPVSKLTYRGQKAVFGAAEQPYPAGIRSSYGMDFVEVVLHEKTDGQPLTIEFHAEPGGGAEFSVQLVKLMDDGTGTSWQPSLTAASHAKPLLQGGTDGHLLYTIAEIDTDACNRLGLIITRLDSGEDADPVGAYTLLLRPGQGKHRGRLLRIERAAGNRAATRIQDRTTA